MDKRKHWHVNTPRQEDENTAFELFYKAAIIALSAFIFFHLQTPVLIGITFVILFFTFI